MRTLSDFCDLLSRRTSAQRFSASVNRADTGEAVSISLPAASDADPEVDESRASATFTISTLRRDRMGDVVEPRGCLPHLRNFERNPQVFFSHRSRDLPIALARNPSTGSLDLQVSDDRIVSTAWFHLSTRESEDVFKLVAKKVLTAASIGFLPVQGFLEEPEREAEDKKEIVFDFGGLRFTEWDLLEWSVVPVPANADALAASISSVRSEALRLHLSKHVPERPLALNVPIDLTTKMPDPVINASEPTALEKLFSGLRKDYDELTPMVKELCTTCKALADSHADLSALHKDLHSKVDSLHSKVDSMKSAPVDEAALRAQIEAELKATLPSRDVIRQEIEAEMKAKAEEESLMAQVLEISRGLADKQKTLEEKWFELTGK